MHNFRNLVIWKKAINLVEDIYRLTLKFPEDEKYGLTSQIRRSAISIPSNVAEGAGKNTEGEFKNFLGIASGSSNEFFSQLILSHKLGFIARKELEPVLIKLEEIQKINYTLIKKFTK